MNWRIIVLLSIMVIGVAWAESDPFGGIGKVSEWGSQQICVILAMYWLRDANQRRVEESQRYASDLRVHNERLDQIVRAFLKERDGD